jgi:hypothetical protein
MLLEKKVYRNQEFLATSSNPFSEAAGHFPEVAGQLNLQIKYSLEITNHVKNSKTIFLYQTLFLESNVLSVSVAGSVAHTHY